MPADGASGSGAPETLLFQRLPEEIRLLQHAQALPDYPKQLLQQVQQEIQDLLARGQQLAEILSSHRRLSSAATVTEAEDGGAATEEEQQRQQQYREDLVLQMQFTQLTLVEILRMRRAYHEERQKILRLMATRACGQLVAFDKETLEKLSDAEQQQLKDLCEGEAARRELVAWEVAAERNGRFPAIGEVVFEKDSYMEDPWLRLPRREEDELALLVAAQATGATGMHANIPPRGKRILLRPMCLLHASGCTRFSAVDAIDALPSGVSFCEVFISGEWKCVQRAATGTPYTLLLKLHTHAGPEAQA